MQQGVSAFFSGREGALGECQRTHFPFTHCPQFGYQRYPIANMGCNEWLPGPSSINSSLLDGGMYSTWHMHGTWHLCGPLTLQTAKYPVQPCGFACSANVDASARVNALVNAESSHTETTTTPYSTGTDAAPCKPSLSIISRIASSVALAPKLQRSDAQSDAAKHNLTSSRRGVSGPR